MNEQKQFVESPSEKSFSERKFPSKRLVRGAEMAGMGFSEGARLLNFITPNY
jgi:hypothetical protein